MTLSCLIFAATKHNTTLQFGSRLAISSEILQVQQNTGKVSLGNCAAGLAAVQSLQLQCIGPGPQLDKSSSI